MAPGGNGWRPQPGPAPRPRSGGHGGAGWVIVIAGVVALGIVSGLLLPVLFALRSPVTSAPGTGQHGAPGHSAGPAAPRPTASARPSASRPAAATGDAIPLRFAGTWRGRADQPFGTVPHWAAVLRLPFGAAGGTFTITTMPCHATVSVTDVGQSTLVLGETAGRGAGRAW